MACLLQFCHGCSTIFLLFLLSLQLIACFCLLFMTLPLQLESEEFEKVTSTQERQSFSEKLEEVGSSTICVYSLLFQPYRANFLNIEISSICWLRCKSGCTWMVKIHLPLNFKNTWISLKLWVILYSLGLSLGFC